MHGKGRLWLLLLCAVLAAGCSKKQEVGPLPLKGEASSGGAMLAYEHHLSIELPGTEIPGRVAAVREACESSRFGACNVLRIEQADQRGSIAVRVIPTGVEPLTALAAQGGSVAAQQTHAEDLAEAVADNQKKLQQLEAYSGQLEQIAQRKDLSVADLISISHERAQVQSDLENLRNTEAQQQRRIQTNVVEISFNDPVYRTRSHRLGTSLGELLDRLIEGLSDALGLLAYGVPFLLLALPLALGWRAAWRWLTRRSRRP